MNPKITYNHIRLGTKETQSNNWNQAIKHFYDGLESLECPVGKVADFIVDRLHYCFSMTDDLDSSIKLLKHVLSYDPNNAGNLCLLGKWLLDRGMLKEAKYYLLRAIQSGDHNCHWAQLSTAILSEQLGEINEAFYHLNIAVQIQPKILIEGEALELLDRLCETKLSLIEASEVLQ